MFVGWGGDCSGTGTCNVTMTSDHNVTATFSSIIVDGAVSSTTADDVSSVTFSHTTGSGTNRLLLVGVSWNSGTSEVDIVDNGVTFTYNGGSDTIVLSQVVTADNLPTNARYSAIYSYTDPPANEVGTISITFSGSVSNGIVAGASNFAGVDLNSPLDTPGSDASGDTQNTTPTLSYDYLIGNELVFDNVFIGASSSSQTLTPGASQAQLWNGFVANTRAASSTKQATGSNLTQSWTAASSAYWVIAGVPIRPAPTSTDHTVTFDANGGTGTMSNQTANTPTALTLNAFTRTGYTFDHWNTLADNTGTSYSDGETYSFAADMTLYAQWTQIPNQPPVVSAFSNQTIDEGGSFTTLSLDDYVTDPDDADNEITWSYNGNTELSVSIDANRIATITAPTDWNGSEMIAFTATDPGGLYDNDAATFTISAVNDAPVNTLPAAQTTDEDTALTFTTGNLVSVSDVDVSETANGKLQVNLSVSHGTLTLAAINGLTFTLGDGTNDAAMTFTATPANANTALNNMTYQPTANYHGAETLQIVTNDMGNTGAGGDLSDTDTLDITVSSVNDDPVITEGESTGVTMSEDGSPTAFSLTLHATDADGDSLSWSLYSAASNGTAGASGTGASVIVSYAPDADWNGSDSFVVEVSDSGGGGLASPDKIGGSDSITVNVTVQAVNDAPVAVDDEDSTPEDTPLVVAASSLKTNDTDIDNSNDQLSVTAVGSPTNGTVGLAGGNVTFTPTAGFSGTAGYDYTVSDGDKADTGHVTVTVSSVNSPPVITEGESVDVNMAKNGVPLAFELTLNATDADGDTRTWSIKRQALNGTASVSTPGTGAAMAIHYTPINNFVGTDNFEVQVSDGAASDTILVNVTVYDTFPVPLEVGWNLVSFSFLPYDTNVETVLEEVFANFDLAYGWDAAAQSWLKYDDVPASTDTLKTWDQTMGMWIKMSAEDTLWNIGTPQPETNISLQNGWNLTGFPDTQSRALPEALTNHGVPLANFTLIYAYHATIPADPWKLYDKSAPAYANDLTNISPIWGYWIQVNTTTPITWHVEYAY
jgi:uncharacterized repeat protein (TIGR02543 family)